MIFRWGRWCWGLGIVVGLCGCGVRAGSVTRESDQGGGVLMAHPSQGSGDAIGREAFGERWSREVFLFSPERAARVRE